MSRGQSMKGNFLVPNRRWMITLLCVGSLLTTFVWYSTNNRHVSSHKPPHEKRPRLKPSQLCRGCKEVINKVLEHYGKPWKKQEAIYTKLRSELNKCCNGFHNAIITQANTPAGTKIAYYADRKKTFQVTPEVVSIFAEKHPFANKTWGTCAVVGNGGILANSSCGEAIDSAQLVMRCNLPPLGNGYEEHVGVKTHLVTANPSIITRYKSLMDRRRPFVELLKPYGDSLVVLPAFTHPHDTALSLRAAYTIEDFQSRARLVFMNPAYMQSLTTFWRSRGLKEQRLSTGFVLVSIALEVCSDVHLYGFWPFSNHPFELYTLTNHYYDDMKPTSVHTMPEEFDILLRLHTQGALRLHLEDCDLCMY